MNKQRISIFLVLALLCACLPNSVIPAKAMDGLTCVLADGVEVGKTYVIVADGQYAMTNRQEGPALRTYADSAKTTLASATVTVSDGVITGEVTPDMFWTVAESTAPAAYDGMEQYFLQDADGSYLRRGSGSLGYGAQLLTEKELYSKIRFNTWSFYPYGDGSFAMYANSERSYGSDCPYYLFGNETSFDSPGRVQRTSSDPFAFTGYDDCSRIQLFEAVGYEPCVHEYEPVVTPPTCTEQGYTTYICARCGSSYESDYTDALLHDWPKEGKVTREATETERGVLTFTCTRCGATRERPLAAGYEKAHQDEILFISDIHSGKNAEAGYHNLRAMFRLLREYDDFIPEVVAGGGDYLESRTYDDADWPHTFEVLHDIMYNASPDTVHALTAGNHDWEWSRQSEQMLEKLLGLPRVGNSYSSEHFEIFQIGAHMNGDDQEEFLQQDIEKLEAFLGSVAGSGKVVFIQTHWPLHYAYNSGEWRATKNADLVIDLLNSYADQLDICFIWGHNHRDDTMRHKFVGIGEELQITKNESVELGFYYVNAGCLNERHAKEGAGPSESKYGPGYLLEARIEGDRLLLDYGHITGAYPDPDEAVYDHNADLLYVDEIQEARPSHYEIQLLHFGDCQHEFTELVTPPTCTRDGYTTYTCSKCGLRYEDSVVAAPGHDYETAVSAPTCTQGGYTVYTCTRCGDSYTADGTDPLGHDYQGVVTAPTCTQGGYTVYTCTRCDDSYTADGTDPLGHDWDEGTVTAEPTETEPGVRTFTCGRCGETKTAPIPELSHVHDYTAAVTAPTCTQPGFTTYTCSCGDSYTADEVPAQGHAYQAAVTAPTCTQPGFATYTCLRCSDSYTADETDPLGHDWDEGTVTTDPTATEPGVRTFTCGRCRETRTEPIPALDHEHSYTAAVTAPTCTEAGFTTYTCACGDSYTADGTDPLGHDWDEGTVTTEPTETEPGVRTFTCGRCGEARTEPIPALDHEHSYTAAVTAPTCTEAGFTTYTCACGDSYTADETAALGHDYAEVITAPTCTEPGYTTYTCQRCGDSRTGNETDASGHDWDDGTVTEQPTETDAGEKRYTCLRCGMTRTERLDRIDAQQPAADKSRLNEAVAAAGRIDRTGYTPESVAALEEALKAAEATRADIAATQHAVDAAAEALKAAVAGLKQKDTPAPVQPNDFRFDDVKNEKAFYYDPVYWAYNANPQITNGVDKTHFGPDEGCTRGQVVTFLWRTAGCPEPTSLKTDFTDLKKDAFYEKAVAWAVEKGITRGMTATAFVPDATCTRGQIVTFLWRYVNTPKPKSTETRFTDVNKKAFYAEAVAWAVENEVTKGMTETTFCPSNTCTRGQIVTFLYRAEKTK